jgi:MMPL family
MFAVLFGLTMDYEVFLVSRMREEWLGPRDNAKAVIRGQAISGRWWLPARLNKHLPHLDIEGDAVASPVEEEVPAKDEVPVPV